MKATAIAPSNIAFIKFWGKTNDKLNLPQNSSISVNLSNLHSTTTVEFDPKFKKDVVIIDGSMQQKETLRTTKHLNVIRKLANIKTFAKVVSKNNFPKGSGLASSASGFAALTLAAAKAANLKLSEKELTTIARLGSGSASRSIPDGFVKWEKGSNHQTSYAHSLHSANFWKINILAIIISTSHKKISSTEGHSAAKSSPFFKIRIAKIEDKIRNLETVIRYKDFKKFGQIIEKEALELHAIALTSNPPIIYLLPESIKIMLLCQKLRETDTDVYFTFDAGPQPVLFCLQKDSQKIERAIKNEVRKARIIKSTPADGAKIITNHLF
ncbi:diphosphomevalonate decarboxylase [Candidatus Curtissbacteria bacterium RIFCSPHIGHO2_01_FULL_41_11]|uniref:diphosphomevalonate decarboxylase n=1 Tax=Candidatus Curtissbacteria bacterium RIFCSPHIGHO2_01_FULL_41_11 TaxID=1797711 RepID=A0A1F5G8K0_9BACT|nr:MAG: diphosphomevalonate decarboxylase [Candidatus Curtissbacteria bacterium RIFCSPHIGHO2_01_FULL_41_11]